MPRAKSTKPSTKLDAKIQDKLSELNCQFQKYEREYEGNTIYRVHYVCHCGTEASVLDNGITKKAWSGCKDCHEKDRLADRDSKYRSILEAKGHKLETLTGDTITYTCKCGNLAKTNARNVKKLISCIKCSNKVRGNFKGFDYAKEAFWKEGIELQEQEYTGNKTKLSYTCPLCEKEAHVSLSELRRGRRCEHCAKDRAAETNLKKYGARNPFQSEVCKAKMVETCMAKHGVRHHFHVPEILKKQRASMGKMKTYTFPSGRQEEHQGWENRHIDRLLQEGMDESNIIVGDDKVAACMPPVLYYRPDGSEHRYYPDIFLKATQTVIEVKCDWTLNVVDDASDNPLKFKATQELGYDLEVHVYDHKGLVCTKLYPAKQQSP